MFKVSNNRLVYGDASANYESHVLHLANRESAIPYAALEIFELDKKQFPQITYVSKASQ